MKSRWYLFIIWLLTSLSKWEILSTGIFIAAVTLVYFLMKKFKKEKEGVIYSPEVIIHPPAKAG